jgi:hypothetical protein
MTLRSVEAARIQFSEPKSRWYDFQVALLTCALQVGATLLSSSMAEHPAVNRRVVGSSPT